jgi:hypothetical protein
MSFVSAYSGEGFSRSPLFFFNGEAERHRCMAQAAPKRWHLLRTGERPCVVSDQELLVLAGLGHLRADDSLWRPDFHGYRTVRSLLGHGTVPPAPSLILVSERSKQTNVEATPGCLGPVETTAPAQKLRRATYIKLVKVAGLLSAVALIGVLGFAMHGSLATESPPMLQSAGFAGPGFASTESHSASTHVQQPNSEPATTNAGNFSGSTGQVELEQGGLIVRKVRIVDIDVSQASEASALVPNPAAKGPSNSVPLPIKEPARPIQSLSSR